MAQKKRSCPKPPKRSVTIRLDLRTLDYFAELADETWIPYQTLINLYLRDCADQKREIFLEWQPRQQRILAELNR